MSAFFVIQLEQIRSGDRSLNLLEYIAELVVRHYYDVHDWYDDLDILNTSSGKVLGKLLSNGIITYHYMLDVIPIDRYN